MPQFHLRKWENRDGKLVKWYRTPFNNKLRAKLITAAAIAYTPGLYALEHASPDEMQQIENKVFGKIETEASPILNKLIAWGPSKISAQERYWWAVYLNASVVRVPHVIARLKSETAKLVEAELSKRIDEFDVLKGEAPETTLFEWSLNHAPARVKNSGLHVLAMLLADAPAIRRIMDLKWFVRDFSSSSRRLLLGDDPFNRVNDLYQARTLVAVPLSPTHAFFGTAAPDIQDNVLCKPPREVVRSMNIETLTTAKQFAYGEAERSFVEQYLLHHSK